MNALIAWPGFAGLLGATEIPDWYLKLPAVNAGLNALAGLMLIVGLVLVKRRQVDWHRRIMVAAFFVSVIFLACYLVYHAGLSHYTGSHGKAFGGVGAIRYVYFAILISHVLLAVAVPVLAIITLRRGFKADWVGHRKIAKITFPIWLYVSITGVVIYFMLYHL